MKWQKWLENWGMKSLKISAPFLEMEWTPAEPDRNAAWELYVELLTRITTQPLSNEDGIEQTALDSIYSLFPTTRAILKSHGRDCMEFAKISVVMLNQKVRPFTAKWHRVSASGGLHDDAVRLKFREELKDLQATLATYAAMLAEMAGIEDISKLEA